MKFIKQVKKVAVKNKKSSVQKVLDYIKMKIESAAERGETSVDIWINMALRRAQHLTAVERGRVEGTLKRMGFRLKDGYDPECNCYTCDFIVSWK